MTGDLLCVNIAILAVVCFADAWFHSVVGDLDVVDIIDNKGVGDFLMIMQPCS